VSVSRLENISKIGVEQMGSLADSLHDTRLLRLENLDTDMRPPPAAVAFTKRAIDDDDANSYLPFIGLNPVREAAARLVSSQSGQEYNWRTECVISSGGLSGILNVLLATLEPGDEVLLTDPTYVGLVNRVYLAGGVPRYVPLVPFAEGWRLDLAALSEIDPAPVRVMLLMSPSMPSGAVFDSGEWQALTAFCRRADCWLINDSAMERILFDDRTVVHPASFSGMRDRVITVGSASKEYRMIGWRVGWVVGPEELVADVARVSISNVVCQTGIAMGAVAAAISAEDDGIADCTRELQARRDLLMTELAEFRPILPHGGWSLLIDMSPFDMDGSTASRRLLEKGRVAATPMVNWGSRAAARYLRLVYSNEPLHRLSGIGRRFRNALL
jgi:N-succinyldiaminopimelate aminotransferase